MMKKFLLGIAMVLAAGSSFAQDYSFSADEFAIKAGEEKDVTVYINAPRMRLNSFQTVIRLPEGLEAVAYDVVEEWSDEIEDFIMVPVYTKPLAQMTKPGVVITTKYVPADQSSSGFNELKIVEFSMPIVRFPYGATTEELFSIKVKATDKAHTGENILIVSSNVNEASTDTSVDLPDAEVSVDYRVEAVIGESGYATFSWPVAVDFSGFAGKARIATADGLKNGFVSRTAIEKVPANTGIILEGEAGSYLLPTTKETTDAATDNILVSTAGGAVTVGASDKFFALAKHDKGVGFYRCDKGVEIPQYRAYINSAAAADAFLFEETTGINNVEATAENADVYTISGVKVEKAAQKGIYIVNGKKVVVK